MKAFQEKSGQPILISGAHRSGTTWVGQTLAHSSNLVYIHEPFSPLLRRQTQLQWGVSTSHIRYWFTYVDETNEADFIPLFQHLTDFRYSLLQGLEAVKSRDDLTTLWGGYRRSWFHRFGSRPRLLIKDPIALFSAEWLSSRFDMMVVVLIRHPAGFASSLKRHNYRHPFSHFLDQTSLMQRLKEFETEIQTFAQTEQDIIDQAILLWRIIYSTVHQYQQQHPEWLFVRYEDLTTNPVEGFKAIFAHCGLSFSEEIERHIVEGLRSNAWGWMKDLSREEIDRVKAGTSDIWPLYYTEEDWHE